MIAYEMLLCKGVIIAWCLPAGLRPAPPLPAEIREQLLGSYREDILRLQHLIGGDHSSWLDGAGVNTAAGARQRKRLRKRLERPDFQAVYGVPHVHGQVDSLDGLGVVEVVDRDGSG